MTSNTAMVGTICVALVVGAGCAGPPPVAKVTGTLRRGDRPLANVRVELLPVDGAKLHVSSIGVTDATGNFQLRTLDGRDGAALGKHRVVLEDAGLDDAPRVSRATEDEPESPATPRELTVDARFRHVVTSPIEVEVIAESAVVEIDLRAWE